jgi:hypothetical protein
MTWSGESLRRGTSLVKVRISPDTLRYAGSSDELTFILLTARCTLDKGYPSVSFNSWKIGTTNAGGNHRTNPRAMARDGIVLLKNSNSSLPLSKPKSIAVIGLDSIVAPKGANACVDRGCNDGTLAMGWGSGSVEFPYLIAPLDAIKTKAQSDGTTITSSPNDNASQGASVAKGADVAIVCINADAGEGYITVEGNAGDRKDLNAWHNGNGTFEISPESSQSILKTGELHDMFQHFSRYFVQTHLLTRNSSDLVKQVAAVNKKTIVVVHSVGPILMEDWIDNPNVVAVVWAGLPGQESGNGLVDILYGAASPSGKLPYTIAKKAEDYGTTIAYGDDKNWDLFIDYRRFDKNSKSSFFSSTHPKNKSTNPLYRYHPTLRIWLRPLLHKLHILQPLHNRQANRRPRNRCQRPRRPRRPLRDRRNRNRENRKHGPRRRRRGAAAVHWVSCQCGRAAQATARLREIEDRSGC